MDAKDLILGITGFALSVYGGNTRDLFFVVSGLLVLMLTTWLNLSQQEEDIRTLKAQINTQNELKRIWRELDEIKRGNNQKRQS